MGSRELWQRAGIENRGRKSGRCCEGDSKRKILQGEHKVESARESPGGLYIDSNHQFLLFQQCSARTIHLTWGPHLAVLSGTLKTGSTSVEKRDCVEGENRLVKLHELGEVRVTVGACGRAPQRLLCCQKWKMRRFTLPLSYE